MTEEPRPDAPTKLSDVDDVIGLAAELREHEANELSLAELEEVGRELDIEGTYIRRAVVALEEKKRAAAEAEAREATRRDAQKRTLTRAALGVTGATLLVLLALWLWGQSIQSDLRGHLGEVQAKRAQVVNVVERKAETERQWRDAAPSANRDAELSGAENRVRIERKRYDEAAARYNAAHGGGFTEFWARRAGLPERVPMSNEVTW